MDLSTAPDAVLEALARAAPLRKPLGPMITAIAPSANAGSHLPEAEAARWNEVIKRAVASLSA